jgi:PHD/YefM family antitoxin component YafN of YafNO toxin-antitoxin module
MDFLNSLFNKIEEDKKPKLVTNKEKPIAPK